jgi:hypothetical protein
MPRLSEAMKDVISCDKLRLVAHTFTRRFPNGATRYIEDISPEMEQTRRTETSKYPEEKKIIMIPLVVASERGLAQTSNVKALLGL